MRNRDLRTRRKAAIEAKHGDYTYVHHDDGGISVVDAGNEAMADEFAKMISATAMMLAADIEAAAEKEKR